MARKTKGEKVAQQLLDMRPSHQVQFSEVELEVLRRMLEHQRPDQIRLGMGLTQHEFDRVANAVHFQQEYELQATIADRGIRKRLDRLSQEALDVVRDVMRTAHSPANQLRAALEILDRSGYVKVEKRITLNADAESVIRELNRIAAEGATGAVPQETDVTPKPEISEEPGQSPAGEEPTDAEFEEVARSAHEALDNEREDPRGRGAGAAAVA